MCAERVDNSAKTILLLSDDPKLQPQIEQALGVFYLSSTIRSYPDLQQFQRSLVRDHLRLSQDAQVDLFMVAFPDDLDRSVRTLTELRQLKRHSLTPVIVFQYREDKAVTRQLYHFGANTVLKYPLNFEAIQKLMLIMDDYWFDTVSLPPHPSRNS
jgi:DNA-binding response OmpR family regulator